jgi:hypothetical protein
VSLYKFVVDRDIPGVGAWSPDQLQAAAAKSNAALRQLAPDIQWIESHVAGDKTFCVYLATDMSVIQKHSQISGFPVSKITEIRRTIDPLTERGDG